jgi:hypothetical protein
VHADSARGKLAVDAARERELRVLGRRVGAGGSVRECAGNRDDVDDVRGPRGLELREKRPHAPDTPEIDGVDDLLDLFRLELEKAAPAREAGVVDEEPDRRVALRDPRRDLVHLRAVGNVAGLRLRAELCSDLLEPLGPPGKEQAVPSARREGARGRGSDPARSSGDDGHTHGATIEIVSR